jgi:hypothetical protein
MGGALVELRGQSPADVCVCVCACVRAGVSPARMQMWWETRCSSSSSRAAMRCSSLCAENMGMQMRPSVESPKFPQCKRTYAQMRACARRGPSHADAALTWNGASHRLCHSGTRVGGAASLATWCGHIATGAARSDGGGGGGGAACLVDQPHADELLRLLRAFACASAQRGRPSAASIREHKILHQPS